METIIKETAPHIRRKDSLTRMMVDIIIALSPVIIFALVIYQLNALRNILLSVATMVLCEFIFVLVTNRLPVDVNKKHTLKEQFKFGVSHYRLSNFLVPTVSGLIYALIMPASATPTGYIYFIIIIGAIFGITIGKLVFGGTGQNIFNPAAAGMIFAKLCFGSHFSYPTSSYFATPTSSTSTGGTALSGGYTKTSMYSLLDMLLGRFPGVLGESFKLAILLGLAYLIIRHAADWRIIISYLGTFFFLMIFAGIIVHAYYPSESVLHFATYELLGGGLLFGATFMATDPVTSPITKPGRVIYGCLLGSCTVCIRLFSSLPEGVAFSILLCNAATPFIDYYKWSTNKFTWKNILAAALIVVIPLLIIVWVLCGELL